MTKKYAIFTLIFFGLVILLAVKLVGNAKEVGEQQPVLSELKVCTSVRSSGPCDEGIETFDPEIGDLYATVYADNIDASAISVKWVYILEGVESTIAEAEEEIYSDDFIQFKLEKSLSKGWLEGSYRVEIELDGLNSTLIQEEFRIQPEL